MNIHIHKYIHRSLSLSIYIYIYIHMFSFLSGPPRSKAVAQAQFAATGEADESRFIKGVCSGNMM